MSARPPEGRYHATELNDSYQPRIIRRPEEDQWVKLLKQKLEQYSVWLAERNNDPDFLSREIPQRLYASIVLGRVLESGSVNTFEVLSELGTEQGEKFNLGNFKKACTVVEAYTKDKGFLDLSVKDMAK